MKSEVLNDSMGSPYVFGYPTLTHQQEISIIAELFEQLLIFDKVTLSVGKTLHLRSSSRSWGLILLKG
jgi:hypothetical protein